MEAVVIGWILLSLIIASYGRKRKIGFGVALLACLLLSPVIGGIIIALSDNESDNLNKLKISFDAGVIDKEEYQKRVRSIAPSERDIEEDKENMRNGCLITIGLAIIGYSIYALVNWLEKF
ncbi:MAG: hypothetical protein Q8P34_16285 [Bacteroidota bacterium]|nr:hypothetical protein [Bacteroidota bacterium]